MTMITPSYLGETIEYSSLHACRSTLEDPTRFTFDPWKDYSGVVMEQGRVQTDADWNEWLSEISRRIQAGTLDTMGHAVYPVTTPYAFQIAATNTGGTNTINIGVGRMYVDGLLVENHGDKKLAVWDSALAELSNSPQPPPSPLQPLGSSNSISFDKQPYNPGATVPPGNREYLVYLDVWKRPTTFIEDPSLVDVAIGVDTTGRMQTAWQVVLRPLPWATVTGSVTSGAFVSGEEVTQSNTGASANLIDTVTGSGPMTIGPITGSADATDTWVGQTSGAVFTPTAAPVGSVSTITGSVTSGTFIANEEVVQTSSGALANLIGTVPAAGPMRISEITGIADATDTWVGKNSGAVFTPTAAPAPVTWSCSTPDSAIPWPSTSGILTNNSITSGPSGPCCLSTGTGYTGPENQFYRVEIHNPGTQGGDNATFKWSRENASVQTNVTDIQPGTNTLGNPTSVLTVQSLGRDQVLGFSAGNWIEITNELADDNSLPGELYKIDSVDVSSKTITLATPLSSTFPASSLQSNKWTRIIRWDQAGKIYTDANVEYYDLDAISGGVPNGVNGIPVPTDGTALILESGLTVQFGLSPKTGTYRPMNYWNFAARSADNSFDLLTDAPPRGIYHHYTKLSVVNFATGSATDCRTPWPPSEGGECGCCTCTVGDGVNSFGKYNSIQQAINALPKKGGEVCILAGDYYENVVLQGLSDIVIHGCGWQTHVYSKSLQSGAGGSGSTTGVTASGLPAVFTLVNCTNIELRSFSVTAAEKEIGILLDRAPIIAGVYYMNFTSNTGVTIEELVLSASTLPAIVARDVSHLKIAENRIAMKAVLSIYSAVYMSGESIFFEHNWVGLEALDKATNRLLATETAASSIVTLNLISPGGIQIAGPSRNVFIVENEITGGSRNGITLGNFIIVDKTGSDTGTLTGTQTQVEDPCGGGGTVNLPGSTGSGSTVEKIASGGLIRNLHIDRNLIHEMGMCGIGPVGFFDLNTTLEVISLENVSITANIISRTMLRKMQSFNVNLSTFGYGAISLPDVLNLTIRDNTITDFGVTPGAEVCGIFVLHGEGIEISRNQIRETRDLASRTVVSQNSYGGIRAGIYIALATPPAVDVSSGSPWVQAVSTPVAGTTGIREFAPPAYEPGLPALRIQENVVRSALGLALHARGTGPFSIVDNHFSTGGSVTVSSETIATFDVSAPDTNAIGTFGGAMTVAINNFGLAIDALTAFTTYSSVYASVGSGNLYQNNNGRSNSTNGTVLFTNNICQLEALLSGIRGYGSVLIFTVDHLLFSNNQLWFDGPRSIAVVDAVLFGISLHATSNRLEESARRPVRFSGLTTGLLNITSQNISSYCLIAKGTPGWLVKTPNLVINAALCPEYKRG